MEKSSQYKFYMGYDFGHKDHNAETLIRVNPDGSISVMDMYRWKTTIDLPKSAHRMKDATAPAQ